ncbi:glycosyltransferase family 1 protein [Candidatus Parcubacteria bacterium]|nr:MAG: glycosyltransferase family 1 protein [Candidatus Parcubacteria bacterium]
MKIAIVCNNLSFITGGPRLAFELARHLGKLGHTVVIYAPDSGGAHFSDVLGDLDIRVVEAKPTVSRSGGFLGWITAKIREERRDVELAKTIAKTMDDDFDVVNVHDIAYRTGYFYKKRNPNAKVIWQENIPLFVYVKRRKIFHDIVGALYWILKRFIDRKYYAAIDGVSVLDKLTKKLREDRGGRNVRIIRAGIDFEKFYAPVKSFRRKAAKKEVHLLAVGALNEARRFDNIIEAVRLLREWGYNARALIVAHNTWRQDKCRDDLMALIKRYHLEPYVVFRFDGMPELELVAAFQGADIFVQAVYAPPPSHQGWGLVNFEAMSAGVPVVLIKSSTAAEVLADGENVFLFEPLHPEQIAEKIKFLVDYPEIYDSAARTGQAFVRDNLSWRKFAEEMLSFFEDIRRLPERR